MSKTATATARHPRITSDPNVMLGKPRIKDTRITVELILRWLSEGRSFAELQEAYPHIGEDDIRAALAYAVGRPESQSRYCGNRPPARDRSAR